MRRSKAPSIKTEDKKEKSNDTKNEIISEKKNENETTEKKVGGLKSTSLSNTKKRKQLLSIKYSDKKSRTTSKIEEKNEVESTEPEKYFTVMWCKRSNKKHKTYSDGLLSVQGNLCKLFDMEAKLLGKTNTYSAKTLNELKNGNTLEIGGKELEIEKSIPAIEFISGRIFKDLSGPKITSTKTWETKGTKKQFKKQLK